MKPGGQLRKGKAFERKVVAELRRLFPDACRRAMQARGGREGADIDFTPGFWIECGHGKRMDPVTKLAQAIADSANAPRRGSLPAPHPVIPLAITMRDRGEMVATMRLTDLVDVLLRALGAGRTIGEDASPVARAIARSRLADAGEE